MRLSSDRRNKIRVAVVERGGLERDLLGSALADHPRTTLVASYEEMEAARSQAPALKPDVVVIVVPPGGASEAVQLGLALRGQASGPGAVFLSNQLEPALVRALLHAPSRGGGGWCYLLRRSVRDLEALVRAIEGAAAGLVVVDSQIAGRGEPAPCGGRTARLTRRQREILRLMAEGLNNEAIARRLFISRKSLEYQINALYDQLGIDRADRSVNPRVKSVLLYLEEHLEPQLD